MAFDKNGKGNLAALGFSSYDVNEKGEIYTNVYNACRKLKPFIDREGYANYSLWADNGKRKTMRGHRLVAAIFLPNPNNLPQINHKDGNPGNNRIENLEWITNRNNHWHSRKLRKPNTMLPPHVVHYICRLLAAGYPEKEIARIANVNQRRVAEILYGRKYTRISQQYTFPSRSYSNYDKPVDRPEVNRYIPVPNYPQEDLKDIKLGGTLRKISEDRVMAVCEFLENGWGVNETACYTGVDVRTVARIKERIAYTEMSQFYSF